MHTIRLSVIALFIALAVGCAARAQSVTLNPQVEVESSELGQGMRVALGVVDARSLTALGQYDPRSGEGSDIGTDQDVPALVREQVAGGLRAKGFKVGEWSESAEPRLKVRIELLEQAFEGGALSNKIIDRATLEALAHSKGATYRGEYRIKITHERLLNPSASQSAEWLSEALGDAVEKLLADSDLLEFIITGKPKVIIDKGEKQLVPEGELPAGEDTADGY